MDSSQAISTKYFRDLLQSETGKFDNLCDIWTKVINEQKSIPEEGKSFNLLLNAKTFVN